MLFDAAVLNVNHEVFVPFDCNTLDAACAGNKLLSAPFAVLEFVPPFAIGNIPNTEVISVEVNVEKLLNFELNVVQSADDK